MKEKSFNPVSSEHFWFMVATLMVNASILFYMIDELLFLIESGYNTGYYFPLIVVGMGYTVLSLSVCRHLIRKMKSQHEKQLRKSEVLA